MFAWDGRIVYNHAFPDVMYRKGEGIYLLSDRKEIINRNLYDYWYSSNVKDIDIDKYIKELLK